MELPPPTNCTGLRLDAAGFLDICRVVDKRFATISVDLLFDLRSQAVKVDAVPAFDALIFGADADATSLLRATSERGIDSLAAALASSEELALSLLATAERMQAHFGGLYEGKLDHVRSTLCESALGVNSGGCCFACSAVQRDIDFGSRLRRRHHTHHRTHRHTERHAHRHTHRAPTACHT